MEQTNFTCKTTLLIGPIGSYYKLKITSFMLFMLLNLPTIFWYESYLILLKITVLKEVWSILSLRSKFCLLLLLLFWVSFLFKMEMMP